MNSSHTSLAKRNIAKWILLLPVAAFVIYFLSGSLSYALHPFRYFIGSKSHSVSDFVERIEAWGRAQGYSLLAKPGDRYMPEGAFPEQKYALDLCIGTPDGGEAVCTLYTISPIEKAPIQAIELRETVPGSAVSEPSALLPLSEFIYSTFAPWLVLHPVIGFWGDRDSYRAHLARIEACFSQSEATDSDTFYTAPARLWEKDRDSDRLLISSAQQPDGCILRTLLWVWKWD